MMGCKYFDGNKLKVGDVVERFGRKAIVISVQNKCLDIEILYLDDESKIFVCHRGLTLVSKEEPKPAVELYEPKVGDTVLIGSLSNKMYDNVYCTPKMLNYSGKTATITEVETSYGKKSYKLDVDNGNWSWASGMFAGIKPADKEVGKSVVKIEPDKIKVGDVIRIGMLTKERDYKIGLATKMIGFSGRTATVQRIGNSIGEKHFKLDVDGGRWSWTADMFAGVESADVPFVEAVPVEESVKFNVGDIVTIGKYDGSKKYKIFYNPSMAMYDGRTAKITARDNSAKHPHYSLDIDKGEWSWTDDMFIESRLQTEKVEFKGMSIGIMYEGLKTTAHINVGGKIFSAEAKCNPTDIYDKEKGKSVAIVRLAQQVMKELLDYTIIS